MTFYYRVHWDANVPIPQGFRNFQLTDTFSAVYQPGLSFTIRGTGVGTWTDWGFHTTPAGELVSLLFVNMNVDFDNRAILPTTLDLMVDCTNTELAWARIVKGPKPQKIDDPYAGVTKVVERCLASSEKKILDSFSKQSRFESFKQRNAEKAHKEEEERAFMLASIKSLQTAMAVPVQTTPPTMPYFQQTPFDQASAVKTSCPLTPRSSKRKSRKSLHFSDDSDTEDSDKGLKEAALRILGAKRSTRH